MAILYSCQTFSLTNRLLEKKQISMATGLKSLLWMNKIGDAPHV